MVRKQGHAPVTKTFSTKAMAERWAREVERDIEARAFNDPRQLERITVGDLIARARREPPALGRTKDSCLRMLTRGLGEVRLSELTKQRIVSYCRGRAEVDGAGPATVAQDLIYLRGLLQTARAHCPLAGGVPPADDARTAEDLPGLARVLFGLLLLALFAVLAELRAYWERPMVRRMLRAPMWDIVCFAIASAMRLSEITAIQWGDVNEADRTVVIRDRKHPSKKIGNDQTVPLLGEAWSILQRQPRTDARIFPFKADSLSANFTRAVLRTRIEDLHFHDLRYHAISLLFEDGYQVQEVALVSGHRDWKQLQRYTQIRPKDLHRD